MGSKRLSFTVTGAFVTKTAREWFWDEHKPWEKVEEFLLACMCGTGKGREELVSLARDVVLGRAKFTGDTADGSYCMVADDGEYAIVAAESLMKRLEVEKAGRRSLETQMENLMDRIIDEDCEWLLEDRRPQEMDMNPRLKSFLEQREIEDKHDDNYGWLEPNGTFHPVEFAEHQGWAHRYITEERPDWAEDFQSWSKTVLFDGAGDFLASKGWVLLHNPGMGVAFITPEEGVRLTKAQKEFLFGYFTDRGKDDLARKYLEDD